MKKLSFAFPLLLTSLVMFSLGVFAEPQIHAVFSALSHSAPAVSQERVDQKSNELQFGMLENVWKILQEKYVHPQVFSEVEPFEYGIIKGLVYGLDDPFSAFMTPEENQDFRDELQGNFQGIGAELTLKSGAITVVTPLKGSPSEAAGIIPEDIIVKVDNEDIIGKPLNEVVKKIRGPKGSKVIITVLRKNEMDTLDITVTRDTITVPSVTSEMKDGDIVYININQFGDDTRKLFNEQFISLMQKNPKGIILDLRFNGGGYLDGAIDIASSFLSSGKDVVQVKTRSEIIPNPSIFKSVTNTETPLIVLINKGSASSSEIVSGALQDHKRALILGEQSFGKGTVQEIIPLARGASLRITIAEWLTPNGHTIDKTGITPNIKVEKTKQDFTDKKDPQLDKALEVLKAGNWKDYLEGKLIVSPAVEMLKKQ